MIKKVTTFGFASILLIVVFFVGTYVGHSRASSENITGVGNQSFGQSSDVDFSPFWKAWSIINDKYVATATTTATSTNQDRVYGAIKGMTDALGDPYTTFFPPEEAKAFEEVIKGNFQGVGLELGVKDSIITVVSAIKDTPAYKAGIKPGDRIVKINGKSTQGEAVEQAVKTIRGEKGTTVTFDIERAGQQTFTVSVVRDIINIPTIETEQKADGVFVIRLFSFTSNSGDLFRNALREFAISKSDKLVLDLRGNPGGYLDAAVDMASWFLPLNDVIVRENFGPNKEEVVYKSKGYNIFKENLKFAILIDGGSASASEILAGALREHHKAILVGTQSFGKGSVQELIPLTPDTNLKVTIARWLTPNGLSISKAGLTPDNKVEITKDDLMNKKDPQMDKAIELLK